MAGKKVRSIEDSVKEFKATMLRASFKDYLYVNQTLYSQNDKLCRCVIVPDPQLWAALLEDDEWKSVIRELDITKPEEADCMSLIRFGDTIEEEGWVEIADPEAFCKGETLKIKVDGFAYDLSVGRDCFPIKLRKAEQNQIAYRIFPSSMHLAIKKKFTVKDLPNHYTILRVFQII